MATKRISELTLRSDFDATCNVPVDDSTQSFRTTGQQLRNYIAPLTTIGDLLYATTSGVAARLGIGTSAQHVLRPVAGVPAWAYPYAVQSTQTTTYSISATGDHVVMLNAAGGAFTATLPTAASVAGKTFILKKIDSTLNAVTIATTSSQTIDGVVGTTLNTQYELIKVVSDGTNWILIDRQIPSEWVAYTPTFAGFGTVSAVNMFSRRVKDSLEIRGSWTNGTVSGTTASLTLGFNGTNTGPVISSTKIPVIQIVGLGARSAANVSGMSVLGSASGTVLNFGLILNAVTVSNVAAAGNAMSGTGEGLYIPSAMVPISGWKG